MTTFEYRRYLDSDPPDRLQAAVDEILEHDWWQRPASYAFPYYADYVDEFLAHRPRWWGEASRDEVIAFGLSSCNCGRCSWDNRPDGSSIAGMPDEAIHSLLLLASQRLADPTKRTRWLEGYSATLVAERRRRRGVG